MKELCGHFINRKDFVCLSVFSVVIIEEKLVNIIDPFVEFAILLTVFNSLFSKLPVSWSKDRWWFNGLTLCSM